MGSPPLACQGGGGHRHRQACTCTPRPLHLQAKTAHPTPTHQIPTDRPDLSRMPDTIVPNLLQRARSIPVCPLPSPTPVLQIRISVLGPPICRFYSRTPVIPRAAPVYQVFVSVLAQHQCSGSAPLCVSELWKAWGWGLVFPELGPFLQLPSKNTKSEPQLLPPLK